MLIIINIFIAFFASTCFCMEQSYSTPTSQRKLEQRSLEKTSPETSTEPEQKNGFIFFDYGRTDKLSDLHELSLHAGYDIIATECAEYALKASISMERFEHQKEHIYKEMIEIRKAMAKINEQVEHLESLRKELNLHSNLPIKYPMQTTHNLSKKKKSLPADYTCHKVNFRSISKQAKKSKESTKQQMTFLKELLETENAHLKPEARERVAHLIYTFANCIPDYVEILDKKIKKAQQQLHQKHQIAQIKQAAQKQKQIMQKNSCNLEM